MPQIWNWGCAVAASVLVLAQPRANAQTAQYQHDPSGSLQAAYAESAGIPVIIAQPQPQVVPPGVVASFSVGLKDNLGVWYQWYFGNTQIPGATSDALVITNSSAAVEGSYSVVVTNSSGSITSSPAILALDSDGDGLPDSWEIAHFGNLTQTATGDFDHDGLSNYREYLDGTDPANSNSRLWHLTAISDGGSLTISPNKPGYTNGESVTLTAVNNGVGFFRAWTGDLFSTNNLITVTMNSNVMVSALFEGYPMYWTSLGSGDWNNPTNWSMNLVPSTNDSVFILPSAITVTLNTDTECNNLTLGANGQTPVFAGSGTLTVHGGNSFWNSGALQGPGRLIIGAGAVVTIQGVSLQGRIVENQGTILMLGPVGVPLSGGAYITNAPGGLIDLESTGSFYSSGRLDNAGLFRKSQNTGTIALSGIVFNNYGTFDVEAGTLSLPNGGFLGGTGIIAAATSLALSGGGFSSSPAASITGAGDFTINGADVTFAGLLNVTGTQSIGPGSLNATGPWFCTNNTLNISSTANFDGTGVVAPATLNVGGNGGLGGSNVVTVLSNMIWSAGTIRGTGRLVISPGATLTIPVTSTVSLQQRTIENAGTILWTGPGSLAMDAGVITNRATGLIDLQTAALIYQPGNVGRIDNAGLLRKSMNTGTFTSAGAVLNNYGVIDLQTGILAANAGCVFAPGSALRSMISSTNTGTGYGQLQAAGTIALNGSLSIQFGTNYTPALNDPFTLVSAGARTGTFASFSYPSSQASVTLSNTPTAVIARVLGLPVGPPQIVSDLSTSQLSYAGRAVALSATLSGAQPFTFQWRKNDTALTNSPVLLGAQSNVLTLLNPAATDSGRYQLFATNSQGSTQSSVETLTVQNVPKLNSGGAGWSLQGTTQPPMNSNTVTLTAGLGSTARSVFYSAPLYIGAFSSSFLYSDLGGGGADGVTFCVQNDSRGAAALGGAGGQLGYGGITNSAALVLNIYAPNTRGIAFRTNGTLSTPYSPVLPVNLGSPNPVFVSLLYTGNVLRVRLSESNTANVFTTNYPINLPALCGGQTAFVGLTGGDGGLSSTQVISNFTFVPLTSLRIDTVPFAALSWPGAIGGYTLQSSTNVPAPAWQGSLAPIVQTNGRNQAIISSNSPASFFRLVIDPSQ